MWSVLDLVLGLVLLMYCLPTVESQEHKKTEIIVGRLENELEFKFLLSEIRDEYGKYIAELYKKGTLQDEIQNQDLMKKIDIKFKSTTDAWREQIIYKNGSLTYLAGNLTEIFMTIDAFVVKKTKLQKEDAGIYWIKFKSRRLVQKSLIITDKPTIIGRSPPNPVLKPEDNYTSTIQLECHSVSTSIGDYPLPMYTVWYKNGMRMTDEDPTLSQINVTVDHNGGNVICLAIDYPPCYQRIQTTKHYDDVLNIEECNNVFESERFKVQPEFAPIDVKLEPDQREIIVTKGEDLKVRCAVKCHPICDVLWVKDDQILDSSNLIYLSETVFVNDLKIENVYDTHEGVYVCLVNNIHGEVKKNFTLNVTETEENEQNDDVYIYLPVIIIVIVIVVIILVIVKRHKRRKKEKKKLVNSREEREPIEKMEKVKKKLLENIEEGGVKMEEEKKMEENIEESQLKKMEELNRELSESFEKKKLKKMEEEKKKLLENIEEGGVKMEEGEKKRLESSEMTKLI